MKTSAKAIEIIKGARQLRLNAFAAPNGSLVIGWGHTENIFAGQKIALHDAEVLFQYDLKTAEAIVNEVVTEKLKQPQFDALVSLAFDIKASNFLASGIVEAVNQNSKAIKSIFLSLSGFDEEASKKLRDQELKLYFQKV